MAEAVVCTQAVREESTRGLDIAPQVTVPEYPEWGEPITNAEE